MTYTVYFQKNSVKNYVSGVAKVVFTDANAKTTTIAAGDTGIVDGSIVKITGVAPNGTPTDFTWDATAKFSESFYLTATGPVNGKVTFKSTDNTTASATLVPTSNPPTRPTTPVQPQPAYSAFFQKNTVQLNVAGGFSVVVMTYADGSIVTIPVNGSGTVDGKVIKVTGQDKSGNSTDYWWSSTVTFNSNTLVNGTGPTNNQLTFASTDSVTGTAAISSSPSPGGGGTGTGTGTPTYEAFFENNKVQLTVASKYSTCIFSYADGSSTTVTSNGTGTLSGSCIKVTGKDASGNTMDYWWQATIKFNASTLINGDGPTNNTLTFKSTDSLQATAAVAASQPPQPPSQPTSPGGSGGPSGTQNSVFFKKNPVQLAVSGFLSLIFSYADGSYTSITSAGSGTVDGTCVRVTGRDSAGKETDFGWQATMSMNDSVLIKGSGPTNSILTFKSTDNLQATALLSAVPMPGKPTPPVNPNTVFFDQNLGQCQVNQYASLIFTRADNSTVSIPANGSGTITGPVMIVSGQVSGGQCTDYYFDACSIYNSDVMVNVTGVTNKTITFSSTDGMTSTAKTLPDNSKKDTPKAPQVKQPVPKKP